MVGERKASNHHAVITVWLCWWMCGLKKKRKGNSAINIFSCFYFFSIQIFHFVDKQLDMCPIISHHFHNCLSLSQALSWFHQPIPSRLTITKQETPSVHRDINCPQPLPETNKCTHAHTHLEPELLLPLPRCMYLKKSCDLTTLTACVCPCGGETGISVFGIWRRLWGPWDVSSDPLLQYYSDQGQQCSEGANS